MTFVLKRTWCVCVGGGGGREGRGAFRPKISDIRAMPLDFLAIVLNIFWK